MIKGVLFDMDGVLVDSEEYICRAAIEMFRENGINAKPEDFLPFVGMGENRYLGGVALKYWLNADIEEIKARTYQIYEKIVKDRLSPLPGAIEFVKQCRDKGFKLALATSADSVKMKVNLREINLSENIFNAVVSGLEVERKKPFPDIYLEAAARLGLKPGECLVVEDAVSGVESAKSAGCRCLALTTSFAAKELKGADWICSTLADVPAEAISW
jgi:HAD superfamily hydrolase (TIGR01509 family)